jgi:hypothetical protein
MARVFAVVIMVTLTGAEVFTPSSVTEVGWNRQPAFTGNPEQANVTVCFEPDCGVTVNVKGDALCPATTCSLLADNPLIVKLGGLAFTVCVNAEKVLPLKFRSPAYDAVIECVPAVVIVS